MIDIVIIVFFCVMSFSIVMAASREAEIFREFNQSRSFAWLSLLFPLGPVVYLVTAFRFGWLVALALMVVCYLPGLITARQRISVFDRSGTDRTRNAQNAATRAFGTAIAGLIYAAVILGFGLIGTLNA